MPEKEVRPDPSQPWENGWTPDTSHIPGTRRLWLAAALAVATLAACLTALVLTDKVPEKASPLAADPTPSSTVPGLISFNTASPSVTPPPAKKTAGPAPRPVTSAPARTDSAPTPSSKPKPPASKSSSPRPRPTTAARTSIRSVNYPDRYWHVSGGYVRLDPIGSGSEQREDASFKRVKGLADSACYSFVTSDGRYLRHRSFVLVAQTNDGSSLFRKDATFCPHYWSPSGTLSLESVNYPGRFLRHRDFQIRLDPYENSHQYHSDASFQMVAGLA